MSSFKLKMSFPDINYEWYQEKDGEPYCPANWELNTTQSFRRYHPLDDIWFVFMINSDTIKIPFKTGELDLIDKTTFTFNRQCLQGTDDSATYGYKISFNDEDSITVDGLTVTELVEETTIILPNNVEYILIEPLLDNTQEFFVFTDIDFEIKTSSNEIITEQNDVSINTNNKISITLDNTLIGSSIKHRDIYYTNELIMKKYQEDELNQLLDCSLLNELLTIVEIDISDEAGYNLANIPSGGLDNLVEYYFISLSSTMTTGLKSYVTLNYKNKPKNNKTYL